MTPVSPLRHFPFYRSRDPDIARRILSDYGVTNYEVTDEASNYQYEVNSVSLRDLTFYHGACSAGVRMKFAGADYIRQRICLAGTGRSTFSRGSSDLNVRKWSAVVPAGESGSFDFSPGYAELRMVVDDRRMRSKLGLLLGEATVDHIAFEPDNDVNSVGLARFRRVLTFLLSELELGGPVSPGAVLDELAETLLISYLYGQKHNFSHRLHRSEGASSTSQRRTAEEFISAHWDQPLSIEDIVEATGVSARSLFRSFKQNHGCSPFDFIKRKRLEQARAILLQGDSQVGVMSVASKCGFHSLGHFARNYHMVFGELPSQTARHARR